MKSLAFFVEIAASLAKTFKVDLYAIVSTSQLRFMLQNAYWQYGILVKKYVYHLNSILICDC